MTVPLGAVTGVTPDSTVNTPLQVLACELPSVISSRVTAAVQADTHPVPGLQPSSLLIQGVF